MHTLQPDISENEMLERWPELLSILLRDQTLSTDNRPVNIFWATNNYADRGAGYQYHDPITPAAITGMNGRVIRPRAVKSHEMQRRRRREMAEVFTPSWICNKQNNLVDNAWFGHDGVFNVEVDRPDGSHSWTPTEAKITFPAGKTWRDYVGENRLEITCGEAPYLASRYDTVTGEPIPTAQRIGLLDRKLRIVSENTVTPDDWLRAARLAYESVYGYEWQGDNLVLARENLLYTFMDYYEAKFGKMPPLLALHDVALIISWNVWQMDGLKGVVPGSCRCVRQRQPGLFDTRETVTQCEGCRTGDIHKHNGVYCKVMDWRRHEAQPYVYLLSKRKVVWSR